MARRLLVPVSLLFLVLLILGSLAPSDSTRTDTSTTPAPPAGGTPVRTIEATLPEDDEVRARVGDIVNLTVESDTPGGVALPDFGETEPVAPDARLLRHPPDAAGDLRRRLHGLREDDGTLVVEDRA